MSKPLIIDAHVHTFVSEEVGKQILEQIKIEQGVPYFCYGTIEELRATMETCGISKSVMVNFAPANWTKGNNFWTCAIAKDSEDLIPFISPHPKMKGRKPVDEIKHKLPWGAKGIKFHPEAQEFYPNDKKMWSIYEFCQEKNLPIVFHSGKNIDSSGQFSEPRLFTEILTEFPKLTLVLAHLGNGFWDQTKKLAAEFQNVYFDTAIAISGIYTRDEKTREQYLSDEESIDMIETVGAERIMFGSDFPWVNPEWDIDRIQNLPLSDKDKECILGKNAVKIYNL
ncbi:MAG: amidohydrolase [Candidatus Heimdallarchaeota archaeon]|nr:MAG: amidohydrolase [Candidatus Heimdallarchaeota archaeon]